jgi:multicomponent Na+:H+ antiporter subunit E
VLRVAGSVVVLAVFWLLLSGFFTPFLVGAGIGSAIAVALFARRMDVMDREGMPLHVVLRALAYFPWLLKEIAKSGWDVTRIILHPALPISPTLVRFKPSQRTALGLVTHANSITLTPGTLSVDVDADEFLVHALTASGAAGVVASEMDRRVAGLESAADETVAPGGRA